MAKEGVTVAERAPVGGASGILALNVAFYFIQYAAMSYALVLSLSLFLKKAGPGQLPVSFILTNLILMCFQFTLMAMKKAPEYLILRAGLIGGSVYMAVCDLFLFRSGGPMAYLAFVVTVNILVCVVIFSYLAHLNNNMPLRMQKECLPYIHGASSLGGVVSGFTLGPIVNSFGTSGVLHFIIALNAVSYLIITRIDAAYSAMNAAGTGECTGEAAGDESDDGLTTRNDEAIADNVDAHSRGRFAAVRERLAAIASYAGRTDLAFYLVVIIFLVNFNENYVDYIFSTKLAERFGSPAEMAAFTGNFRAFNLLAVMFVQFFALRPFLKYLSVSAAVSVMPLLLLPCLGGAAIAFTFASALLIKFSSEISIKGFHRPAIGILTNPMGDMKISVSLLFEQTTYVARILAGISMLALKGRVNIYYLLFPVAALLAVHLAYSRRLSGAYVSILKENLGAGTEAEKIKAIGAVRYVGRDMIIDSLVPLLDSPDAGVRYSAIAKIAGFERTADILSAALARENDPRNIATIVSHLSRASGEDFEKIVGRYWRHEDARVRANIIEGIGKLDGIGRYPALPGILSAALRDNNPRIAANAVVSVLAVSDSRESIDEALETLLSMAYSGDEHRAASAAAAMGLSGHPVFTPALAECLASRSVPVRRNAIVSLCNLNTFRASEVLKKHAGAETDPRLAQMTRDGISMASDSGMRLIVDILQNRDAGERAEVTEILKGIDTLGRSGQVLSALSLSSRQSRLETLRFVAACSGGEEQMALFEKAFGGQRESDGVRERHADPSVFSEYALACGFAPGEWFYDLYRAALPEFTEENNRYILRLLDVFAFVSRAGMLAAEKGHGGAAAEISELEKRLLDHTIRIIALAAPDYREAVKAFEVAVSGDKARASYALELIENNLSNDISVRIADTMESFKSAEKWLSHVERSAATNAGWIKREIAGLPENFRRAVNSVS